MIRALWTLAAVVALLWPAALAGPLDGAPLDRPAEVLLIAGALAVLLFAPRRLLASTGVRSSILALLIWKAGTAAVAAPDGWCLQFTTSRPVYHDMGLVPHAWDVRADWRSATPECSAIVTRSYPAWDHFPVWFFNLPPASHVPPEPADRPPDARFRMEVRGRVYAPEPGELSLEFGEDMIVKTTVDGVDAGVGPDIQLAAGPHEIQIAADLTGTRWRLAPLWNGRDLWSADAPATRRPLSTIDRAIRPWGRYVPAVLVLVMFAAGGVVLARGAVDPVVFGGSLAMSIAIAFIALVAPEWTRWSPLVLVLPMALTIRRPWRNTQGFVMLVVVPWLVLFGAMATTRAAVVTLYTAGDDWWMFQRYAYRVFLQGYWLEGGQPTFWFQPLYRWIAGALHMVFGDSSVGEWLWDGLCVAVCAGFAFKATARAAGFGSGLAAAVVTLLVFTLGPAWYLFGRGLSEISSAGFLSGAALYAMRGRHGDPGAIAAAGLLATLAFYTRMNNLPMAIAVAGFAFSLRQPVQGVFHPSTWLTRASRPVIIGVAGSLVAGLLLFAARTWYYTGIFSVLYGTQADARSMWNTSDPLLQRLGDLGSSVLMVMTMSDPPRFDLRALPVMAGVVLAVAGVVGIGMFRRLPLGLVGFCLAGVSGALVARGSAYPGRFSVHLVAVTVSLVMCALALWAPRRLRHRRVDVAGASVRA